MERLNQFEEKVMLHIWQFKECTIHDVAESMNCSEISDAKLMATFSQLGEKGYVKKCWFNNVELYSPAISKEAYESYFLSGVVKNHFGDSYKELVSFFVKQQKISVDDLKDIIRLIEENKKKQSEDRSK